MGWVSIGLLFSGILLGGIIAFILTDYYLNRNFFQLEKEKEKKYRQRELSLKNQQAQERKDWHKSRRHMVRVMEDLHTESNRLKLEMSALEHRDHAQAQHIITAVSKAQTLESEYADLELEMADLERKHQGLQQAYNLLQLQLDLAEATNAKYNSQLDGLSQQVQESRKMQEVILFATNQLQILLAKNHELETQIAYQEAGQAGKIGLGFIQIEDIEPVHAVRLYEAGIHSLRDLVEHDPNEVARVAEVSPDTAVSWIEKAQQLAADDHAESPQFSA